MLSVKKLITLPILPSFSFPTLCKVNRKPHGPSGVTVGQWKARWCGRPGVIQTPRGTDTSLTVHGTHCSEGADVLPKFWVLSYKYSLRASVSQSPLWKQWPSTQFHLILATYLFNSILFHQWSPNKSESNGLISFLYLILSSTLVFPWSFI